MGKHLLASVSILCAVFLIFTFPSTQTEAADSIKFSMDWVIGGQHAAFFTGLDRGNYEKAGIKATLDRGFGGSDTVKKVAAGAADFVFSDVGAMVIARSQGAKVKDIATIYDRGQYVLFALKGSGIQRPKDIEGRTIADSAGSVIRAVFPALAAANKVDESKVKWLHVDPALIFPSLLGGKADLAAAFAVNRPSLEARAREMGKELVGVYFADWGLDIYSNGLLTSDDMIAKKPDLVRRFSKAALESLAWTIENQDAAIDILMKYHPVVDKKIALAHLKVMLEAVLTPAIQEKGLGYIREDKMTQTRDILTQYMRLPVTVPVKDLYTMEFLPQIMVKK